MDDENLGSPGEECPACESQGRPVKAITIESLVTKEARARVGSSEGFRFCSEGSCDVVYFNVKSIAPIMRSEVLARIGQKEDAPSRPICYCFEHTAEEIEAEVSVTGTSKIADDITDKCREGLQRCEQTNPQGSCCLGNVRQAVKAATARRTGAATTGLASSASLAAEDCCSSADTGGPETNARRPSRGGLLATSGALVAAALSSACCWLPLLLIALGVSTVGIAGFIESYRPYLLGVTVLFLGVGFYLVYGRRELCADDALCPAPNPRRDRFQRITLWAATILVLSFALFPDYVGYFFGDNDSQSGIAAPDNGEGRAFRIDGMTCEACAVTLRERLMGVPGVARADVSFASKSARVFFSESQPFAPDETLLEAIKLAGYEGQPIPVTTKVQIQVSGMTCAGCAAGLQDRLVGIPGVGGAQVVYESSQASVALDDPAALDAVLSAIEEDGFDTVILSESGLPE